MIFTKHSWFLQGTGMLAATFSSQQLSATFSLWPSPVLFKWSAARLTFLVSSNQLLGSWKARRLAAHMTPVPRDFAQVSQSFSSSCVRIGRLRCKICPMLKAQICMYIYTYIYCIYIYVNKNIYIYTYCLYTHIVYIYIHIYWLKLYYIIILYYIISYYITYYIIIKYYITLYYSIL